MTENDRAKEMIEAAVTARGLAVKDWRDDPDDGLTAVLGRFRVAVEDEREGLYDGDEGVLIASVVGARQYGNERIYFGWTPDGMDEAGEVRDIMALDPID
jgi:hypothetical protein